MENKKISEFSGKKKKERANRHEKWQALGCVGDDGKERPGAGPLRTKGIPLCLGDAGLLNWCDPTRKGGSFSLMRRMEKVPPNLNLFFY
jgi:hypothetical protein